MNYKKDKGYIAKCLEFSEYLKSGKKFADFVKEKGVQDTADLRVWVSVARACGVFLERRAGVWREERGNVAPFCIEQPLSEGGKIKFINYAEK